MHIDPDLDPNGSQDFYPIFLGSDPNKLPTESGSGLSGLKLVKIKKLSLNSIKEKK